MKRALLVTAGTAVGLTATLAYTPRPMVPAGDIAGSASPQAADALVPAPAAVGPVGAVAAPAPADTAAAPDGSAASASSAPAISTGPLVPTRFGDVQVQISVAEGRVVDVVALAFPAADSRSASISASAIPILRSESLSVVDASDVATVSGATYTSEAWRTSLAAALAEAGL